MIVSIPHRFLTVVPAGSGLDCLSKSPLSARRVVREVLLVEDNDSVPTGDRIVSSFRGFRVQSAPSAAGAEGLFEIFERGDVVVADYHLDGRCTGLELLTRLRQRLGSNAPAVVLSGDLPSVLFSLRTPVWNCRFLSKPVDAAALLDAVDELSCYGAEPPLSAAGLPGLIRGDPIRGGSAI